MKRLGLTVFLLFSITAVLFLTSFGTLSQHAKTIEAAIVDYSDYYIEVYDLSDQVREQYKRPDRQQSAIDYTITIDIPNYSSVDTAAIGFIAPAPDYEAMSASQYRAASAASLRTNLEAYAYENAFSTYIELPVTFSLTNTGSEFSAAMSQTSRNDIKTIVDGMVNSLLLSYGDYTENYRLATVADSCFHLLKSPFGVDYTKLIEVRDVVNNGDGTYDLTIAYPDPYDVYASLAQQYYDSFNQPFYGVERVVSLGADDLSGIDTAVMDTVDGNVTIACDADSGAFALFDAFSVEQEISAARSQAEAAVAVRINDEWRVPEVEAPSNGAILEGKTGGNQIVFVSDASLGKYCYVRFYLLPGEDVDEDGTLAAGIFIVGGKKATVYLPSGYYRIVCYVGDAWYGLSELFGPDGTSFDGGNAIRSRSGYVNTISFE